jgi:hypothetical protein
LFRVFCFGEITFVKAVRAAEAQRERERTEAEAERVHNQKIAAFKDQV